MANKIEHLVVLMMENRSFDHMLGFLRSPDWPIDGLTGAETNPDAGGAPVRVTPDAAYSGDLAADPGHDFVSVNEQVFGNSAGTGAPNMQGFVRNYHGKTKDAAKSRRVMKCFGPGRLPALSTLAREYAVCDRWFSSVPGPTLPNRAFAWAGTSLGRVDMNPNYLALKTVFELLDGHGVSSKIYFTDVTVGLTVRFLLDGAKKFFAFFDAFREDCKKDRLPAFSFIFRDRHLALLQTEYLRSLYGPLDFIAFYDTGKVAPSLGRFGEGRLRHTGGLGVVVVPRRLDNVLFRFYVGLGSGEGSHTYFGGGSGVGKGDRLVR